MHNVSTKYSKYCCSASELKKCQSGDYCISTLIAIALNTKNIISDHLKNILLKYPLGCLNNVETCLVTLYAPDGSPDVCSLIIIICTMGQPTFCFT